MSSLAPVELDFSRKYDQQHAVHYLHKHQDGLARRVSHWRDQHLARQAMELAGDPGVVLDLPCGAGRFWPLLAERQDRRILAADNSGDMIAIARRAQHPDIVARVRTFQTSAFDIDLDDETVDCVFCMRLLHHVAEPAHRLAMLRELHRVSRDTVIVSLWVDGNFKAWRRQRLERLRQTQLGGQANQNRFVIAQATIEAEFRQAGFAIVGHGDFLPGYAMWRVYTLRKLAGC